MRRWRGHLKQCEAAKRTIREFVGLSYDIAALTGEPGVKPTRSFDRDSHGRNAAKDGKTDTGLLWPHLRGHSRLAARSGMMRAATIARIWLMVSKRIEAEFSGPRPMLTPNSSVRVIQSGASFCAASLKTSVVSPSPIASRKTNGRILVSGHYFPL